ncbi:MAG: hypothetical protein P1U68_17325 [Verrucomicrobiales bacterium]|nr:hypothetical protein [Verrucomicrobiales bacterium]
MTEHAIATLFHSRIPTTLSLLNSYPAMTPSLIAFYLYLRGRNPLAGPLL